MLISLHVLPVNHNAIKLATIANIRLTNYILFALRRYWHNQQTVLQVFASSCMSDQ